MNVNPISFGSVYKVVGNYPSSSGFRMFGLMNDQVPADNNEKIVKTQLRNVLGNVDSDTLRIFRNHKKDVFLLTGQDKVDLEKLIADKQQRQKLAFQNYMGDQFMINAINEAEEDRFRDLSQLITYCRQDGVLNVDYDMKNGTIRTLNVEV